MSYILEKTGLDVDDQLTTVIGGIHLHDNSTSQTIANGASYVKVINFSGNNDACDNLTCDYVNNKITILKAGKYTVNGAFSFASDTNNIYFYGTLFVNEVEINSCHFKRKISTVADVGAAPFSDTVELAVDDILTFRARHDNGSPVDVTFVYANLNASRSGI